MASSSRILVVGDVILDSYEYCHNRQNPESSAPCYIVVRTEHRPGGAGNVAANLSSLGDQVVLVSIAGTDHEGGILENVLLEAGVSRAVQYTSSRVTTVKERLLDSEDHRYHARKDKEQTGDLVSKDFDAVKLLLERQYDIFSPSLVVVSDYVKGLVTPELMDVVRSHSVPFIVAPKPPHVFYDSARLIVPNASEARILSGESDELVAGGVLARRYDCDIVVTRGSKGMALCSPGGMPVEYPSQSVEVFDVTGAGDTVVAILAHCLARGESLDGAIKKANKAGGIAVQHAGCYRATVEDIGEKTL